VRPVERALAEVDSVNIHAGVAFDGRDRKRLEHVLWYLARPPLALDRLEQRGTMSRNATSEGLIDFSTLIPEVEAKLAFRGRTREAMTAEVATKEARYKKLWAVRLSQQMAALPPFDDVFRAVRRSLRDAGLVER